MREYQFEWYPVEVTHTIDVVVDGKIVKEYETFRDEIKGHNPADALLNAWHNWEHALKIRLI